MQERASRSHGPALDIQAVLNSGFGVKTTAHGMGASPGSAHIMNLEDYQVNFHVSTSMRKGVWGGGGNRRHWFDKYSSRLSMFLALQIELWARKRACLHRVYRPGHFGKTDEIQVILCSALLKYSPVEKVLLSLESSYSKRGSQQHQHLLGAYQKSRIPSLTLDLPIILARSQGTHVLIKICKVVVGKPSFQSGVFGDSTGHTGFVTLLQMSSEI